MPDIFMTDQTNEQKNSPQNDDETKLKEKIKQLEKELHYTKDCMQSMHEELMAYGELLHSNEELQAIHKELLKVKSEYHLKQAEVGILNNDLSNYFSSGEIAIVFLDKNLHVRKYTSGMTKELNVKPCDIGRPMRDITHHLISDDLNTIAEETLNTKIPTEKEVQSKTKNWYVLKCAPYYLSDHTIDGVIISLVDITRSKLAEINALNSASKIEQLIEKSPYSIFIIQDERFIYSNSVGLDLLKFNHLSELRSHRYKEFFTIEEDNLVGDTARKEDIITLPGGQILNVEVSAIPYIFDRKAAKLLFVKDVSYRAVVNQLEKELEENAKLMQEKILFENLTKEFFGTLSHELRTPLNVIFSALQLLDISVSHGELIFQEEKIKWFGKIMKQNCYRQMKLINNMIDITKIDSGINHMNITNIDIVNIIRTVTQSVTDYVLSKEVDLFFESAVDEYFVSCDAEKIERVMLNLLSNALKFTDAGGKICVTICTQAGSLFISVRDTGIGIPQNKLGVIFDRFRQVDKSSTRNAEGIGLGLYIAKSLVELHNGRISVSSEYGKGTEFIISLPALLLPEDLSYCDFSDAEVKKRLERVNTEFSDVD